MLTTIADQLKAARRVSTPLVAITTADPSATIAGIVKSYNGTAPPILQWDLVRGVAGINDQGRAARAMIVEDSDLPGVPLQSPAEAMAAAVGLPERSLLFAHNAGRILDNAAVIQAICNLRDPFKANGRTLVLLAPSVELPGELVQDVLTIDEALPSEAQIEAIIVQEVKNARETMKEPPEEPSPETLRKSIEALAGLAAFPVEQAAAMSLASARRLDVDQLWARKRSYVRQTPGLSIDDGATTFADLGGLENAKVFGAALFAGKNPPRAIVRIDEIEKMLGGAAGDTSGVSQDALGTILREMEDQDWAGVITVGPPGSGKSAFSKALGATHGSPTFALDLGATKGSLVGQSEQRIRAAMKTIKAVAAAGAFFVATCNKLDALPPELRRRFRYGLWFFDLPTKAERARIWALNLARFSLAPDAELPGDEGWTGAEIRNACEMAFRMALPLPEVARRFIVPVAVSDPQSIDKLRTMAHGKFLSASAPGSYVHPKAPGAPPAGSGRAYTE